MTEWKPMPAEANEEMALAGAGVLGTFPHPTAEAAAVYQAMARSAPEPHIETRTPLRELSDLAEQMRDEAQAIRSGAATGPNNRENAVEGCADKLLALIKRHEAEWAALVSWRRQVEALRSSLAAIHHRATRAAPTRSNSRAIADECTRAVPELAVLDAGAGQSALQRHIATASAEVAQWPAWKRAALRPYAETAHPGQAAVSQSDSPAGQEGSARFHYYAFAFTSSDCHASVYIGYPDKDRITMERLAEAKREARVGEGAVLMGVSYLGHMSQAELQGEDQQESGGDA